MAIEENKNSIKTLKWLPPLLSESTLHVVLFWYDIYNHHQYYLLACQFSFFVQSSSLRHHPKWAHFYFYFFLFCFVVYVFPTWLRLALCDCACLLSFCSSHIFCCIVFFSLYTTIVGDISLKLFDHRYTFRGSFLHFFFGVEFLFLVFGNYKFVLM